MPTSAVGSRRGWRPFQRVRRAGRGFTLLELLVVIAIIAVATAGVSFAMRDSAQAALDREAERLAALLESARAQSRASGIVVRWRPTPEGPGNFAFDGLPVGTLPTMWLNEGIAAQPMTAGRVAMPALQLGPDPIIPSQQVLLTSETLPNRSLIVGTDGLRPFTVMTP
ncbi:Tfp pilus assembly protein FimT/FimU [Variovorax sp. YR216]|uniref:pilus assembly FimT family protein n=1 Tax=Variovorax sp. YR216 TaxID=1882828 RepID=UPI000898437B|nr:prepilin-type N-terminal cleavage/methylation domain-containing protein [Variovorax sp. YR216]SEA94874.1 general secretion pathway protein H [Variovorax sp. YR216]